MIVTFTAGSYQLELERIILNLNSRLFCVACALLFHQSFRDLQFGGIWEVTKFNFFFVFRAKFGQRYPLVFQPERGQKKKLDVIKFILEVEEKESFFIFKLLARF